MSAVRRHYIPMTSEINTRSKTDLLVTHFKQSESEWTSKVNKLAKKKKTQLKKRQDHISHCFTFPKETSLQLFQTQTSIIVTIWTL